MTLSSKPHGSTLSLAGSNASQPDFSPHFSPCGRLGYTPYPPSRSWAALLLQRGLCYFLSLFCQKLLIVVKNSVLFRGSSSQYCHLQLPQWKSLLLYCYMHSSTCAIDTLNPWGMWLHRRNWVCSSYPHPDWKPHEAGTCQASECKLPLKRGGPSG